MPGSKPAALWSTIVVFIEQNMSLFKSTQKQPDLVRSVSYPYRAHGTRHSTGVQTYANQPKNMSKQVLLLFVVALVGFVFLAPNPTASPKTLGVSAQQAAKITEPEPEPLKTLDHTIMNNEINAIISDYPSMDIGVSWVDIKSGESGNYGVQAPFVAASTAKLLTAIAYLHDVEAGDNTLTEQVGTRTAQAALEAMIVDSDNQAWDDFNNTVMSHQELAAYAQTIGFSGYDPDANTVTPESLGRLLSNLYQKRLLNDVHTALLLSYMERAKEVPYFSDSAPAGVKVYHKPGYLKDRVHDAAIIDNGDRPYVLIVFTKSRNGTYTASSGVDIFTSIAKSSYSSFIGR